MRPSSYNFEFCRRSLSAGENLKKWRQHSRLTVSAALAKLRPAELMTTQRNWPWFPGRALATVSTDPSGPIFTLSGKKQDTPVNTHTSATLYKQGLCVITPNPGMVGYWLSSILAALAAHCSLLGTWSWWTLLGAQQQTEAPRRQPESQQPLSTHTWEDVHTYRSTLWTFTEIWMKCIVNECFLKANRQQDSMTRIKCEISHNKNESW